MTREELILILRDMYARQMKGPSELVSTPKAIREWRERLSRLINNLEWHISTLEAE